VPSLYSVLDLFAGAGGMSLGFSQTDKFRIVLGVEKNTHAQATYKENHKETKVIGDILGIKDYCLFRREYGDVDVVVGGPPCQGFSNANRQRNHIISQNNSLVKKYVEIIENLQPKAFVMENVSMLRSETHRFFCTIEDHIDIQDLKIEKRVDKINIIDGISPVADIEQYLFEPEILHELLLPEDIIGVLRLITKHSNNKQKREDTLNKKKNVCYKALQSIPKRTGNVSHLYKVFENEALEVFRGYLDGKLTYDEASCTMKSYVAIQKSLSFAKEIVDNKILVKKISIDDEGVIIYVYSYSVIDYITKKMEQFYVVNDGLLNAAWFGAPQLRERYIALGIRKDLVVDEETSKKIKLPTAKLTPDKYRNVWDAIVDLEDIKPSENLDNTPMEYNTDHIETILNKDLRDSVELTNHIVTKTGEKALRRFETLEQGQNFHDLDKSLVQDSYSNPDRTQNSIYLRLDYKKPCGTVTNVRKAMWVHPTINRAISIREAARLQTFPDSFLFLGSKDSQYQQVGNAVPPLMAKSIAEKLASLLDECMEKYKLNQQQEVELSR
jgi:DNA (cytosine-5)-methyltransferase 1